MTTHDNEERAARGGQLTQADVSKLFAAKKYEEIAQARADGRCNVMMGGEPPRDPGKEITAADISELFKARRFDEISQLRSDHKLDHLFDPTKENNS
jgi:Glu-tRNA(Gln) amidotransferase subunit E-like FAD-binding protein